MGLGFRNLDLGFRFWGLRFRVAIAQLNSDVVGVVWGVK